MFSRLRPDDSEPLGLLAIDAEDLAIISAHLQDAILRPADITWRANERRLAFLLRRFDWSPAARGPQRRLSALHFNRVTRVVHKDINPQGDPLNLLAISFEPGEAPSGALRFDFSGGGVIRAEIECIEAQLKDLGPVWEAARRPSHDQDQASDRDQDRDRDQDGEH